MKKLSKLFITIILFIICMILIKGNPSFKTIFYKKVYEDSFNFGYINSLYNKYFGNILPFEIKEKVSKVFSENLSYESSEKYLDGVKLKLTNDLVPVLNEGLVIFIGEKEGYGSTVIINGIDGVDIWYSNLDSINVKLYDYVTKGSLLGSSNLLYLVYKKDGEVLDYNEYIN